MVQSPPKLPKLSLNPNCGSRPSILEYGTPASEALPSIENLLVGTKAGTKAEYLQSTTSAGSQQR